MGRPSEDDDSDLTYGKHPALRNFNRTAFMFKHVLKSVLKWGAIGALAGAAAAIAMAAMALAGGGIWTPIIAVVGVLLSKIPGIGDGVAAAGGWVGKAALTSGMYLAGAGGIIGAAVGGIVAISNVSEAADAEEDRLVAKYEQQEARRNRMKALEKRRDEQRYAMEMQNEAMHGAPNMQIPRGRPMGHHAGAGMHT